MALYAFDGTGQTYQPDLNVDSNVVWFYNAYTGHKHYLPGVGTGGGIADILGLATGFGGHDRIRSALKFLNQDLKNGDHDIDIIGFSRGAAEAVDFANEIARTKWPRDYPVQIRFLGVWDIVGSFDLPGTPFENIGFNFDTPPRTTRIVHCMALDERRVFFPLTRMRGSTNEDAEKDRLFEVWFRGVHSDVGGGDLVTGLSSITLNFMFEQAINADLPIDQAQVDENRKRMDASKPISFDLVHALAPIEESRTQISSDYYHHSVTPRPPVEVNGLPYEYNNPRASLIEIGDCDTCKTLNGERFLCPEPFVCHR
jgi:uncharacterized protein (DUF2235 family)